jgi:hypothetical protein
LGGCLRGHDEKKRRSDLLLDGITEEHWLYFWALQSPPTSAMSRQHPQRQPVQSFRLAA